MATIHIPKMEQEVVRVFSLSIPQTQISALMDKGADEDVHPLAAALGATSIDTRGVEVFALNDLGGITLSDYLIDANDVVADGVERDRQKLNALSGHVMLVFSSAFGDDAQELTPQPEFTLIGTYSQAHAAPAAIPLDADAAQPYTGTPGVTPPQAPKGRAGGSMIVVGLVVLAALILWWVLG